MTEFYIPASGSTTLASGRPFKLRKGIHTVPDELANSPDANKLGIKPVDEMTDDEWRGLARDKDAYMKARADEMKVAAQADADAKAKVAAAIAAKPADAPPTPVATTATPTAASPATDTPKAS